MVRNPSLFFWLALVGCLALLVVFVDVMRSTWFLFFVALLLSLFIGLAIVAPEMVWKARMLWSGTFGDERRLEVARSTSKVSPLLEDAVRRSDEASCRGAIDFCIGDAHGLGAPLLDCCAALIGLRKTYADAVRRGLPRELAAAVDSQAKAASANLSTTADRIALFAKQGAWNDRIELRVAEERRRLLELADSLRACQAGLAELMLVGIDRAGVDLLGVRLNALGEAAQDLSDAVA